MSTLPTRPHVSSSLHGAVVFGSFSGRFKWTCYPVSVCRGARRALLCHLPRSQRCTFLKNLPDCFLQWVCRVPSVSGSSSSPALVMEVLILDVLDPFALISNEVKHLFMYLLDIYIFIQIFCPFLIELSLYFLSVFYVF